MVYVVIEWTGNSQEVDGAIIHAVHREHHAAQALADALWVQANRVYPNQFEVQAHELA
jgi:hypothetical protein